MSLNLTGNNLIQYPYQQTSLTTDGITFTDNGDGTITANGTATADASFKCWAWLNKVLPSGSYFVSGCPQNGSVNAYYMNFAFRYNNINFKDVRDIGAGALIEAPNGIEGIYAAIRIKSGITVENLVFKPMLNKGTTALPYEPYKSINPENIRVNLSSNLIVYPYRYSSLNDNGITFTTNDNGEIIANGSIEDNTKYPQLSLNADAKIFNIQKDIYTMSCPMSINDTAHTAVFLLDFQLDNKWVFTHSVNNIDSLTKTIDLRDKEFNQVYGYVRILANDTGTFEDFTFKPMLNKGTSALPYEPYIAPKDVEKVVVAKSPNLIPYPYTFRSTTTLYPDTAITATINEDGSIAVSGTKTSDSYTYTTLFNFTSNPDKALKVGETYTISGGSPECYVYFANTSTGGSTIDGLSSKGEPVTAVYSTYASQSSIYLFVPATPTGTEINVTLYPQIVKGTTALPYQKYDREVVWSKTGTSDETTDEETTV